MRHESIEWSEPTFTKAKHPLHNNSVVLEMSALNIHNFKYNMQFNPKRHGGGLIQSIAREIACHFSQDHTMVTKFLDFVHKHPKYKVVK